MPNRQLPDLVKKRIITLALALAGVILIGVGLAVAMRPAHFQHDGLTTDCGNSLSRVLKGDRWDGEPSGPSPEDARNMRECRDAAVPHVVDGALWAAGGAVVLVAAAWHGSRQRSRHEAG